MCPRSEFSFWGLSLAQRPENFRARGCSLDARELCVDKRGRSYVRRVCPVKNCRRDTVISTREYSLSSRYYSYFLSAPGAAMRVALSFSFRLFRAGVRGNGGSAERERERSGREGREGE